MNTTGLIQPEDGIKKLRQMELASGIWTMRCQLIIQDQDIIIRNAQNGEQMEKFALSAVTNLMANTSTSSRGVYSSVLQFTVEDRTKQSATSEMHIFHCANTPAQEIADEIKLANFGRPQAPTGGDRMTGA